MMQEFENKGCLEYNRWKIVKQVTYTLNQKVTVGISRVYNSERGIRDVDTCRKHSRQER